MSVAEMKKETEPRPLENRIPPPFLAALIAVGMGAIAWFTPGAALAILPRVAIGAGSMLLGASLVMQGARTFWRAGTTIDPVHLERAATLVTSGVFRWTRNPMYVGFSTVLFGWTICLGAPWAIVGPLAFVLFTDRFQIVPEERMMRLKFGQEYKDYCKRVRRWL